MMEFIQKGKFLSSIDKYTDHLVKKETFTLSCPGEGNDGLSVKNTV